MGAAFSGALRAASGTLSKEVIELAEANITSSGKTILGSYPGYITKAKAMGASYFDIGPAWDTLTPAQQWAANQHFLDLIAAKGDQVTVTVAKSAINPTSQLAKEVEYLINVKRYHWIGQFTLGKP